MRTVQHLKKALICYIKADVSIFRLEKINTKILKTSLSENLAFRWMLQQDAYLEESRKQSIYFRVED